MRRHEKWDQPGLHRSRSGIILGVCRGLADYLGIAALWIRLAAVIVLLATGLWPITLLYIITAFIMKPEPTGRVHIIDGRDYGRCRYSSEGVFQGLRHKFKKMDQRIRHMEDIVTDRAYDWDRRMNL
jgi:phage shock protein C